MCVCVCVYGVCVCVHACVFMVVRLLGHVYHSVAVHQTCHQHCDLYCYVLSSDSPPRRRPNVILVLTFHLALDLETVLE